MPVRPDPYVILHGSPGAPGIARGRVRFRDPDYTEPLPGRTDAVFVGASPLEPTRTAGCGYVGAILEGTGSGAATTDLDAIPIVTGLEADLFREEDAVQLDGATGTVTLEDVRGVEVVTAFVERSDGRILLLRRSDRVGSFRGLWAAVSGFLEDATEEGQARREVEEETSIPSAGLRLERAGALVYARDGSTLYQIHPFRFRTATAEVRLDWEHTASEWVDPMEILRRPCVPKLDRAWKAVAPP